MMGVLFKEGYDPFPKVNMKMGRNVGAGQLKKYKIIIYVILIN